MALEKNILLIIILSLVKTFSIFVRKSLKTNKMQLDELAGIMLVEQL